MTASASGCIVNFAGEIMQMYRILDHGFILLMFIKLYNEIVKLNGIYSESVQMISLHWLYL